MISIREVLKAYFADFVITILILVILYVVGFRIVGISAGLFAAIFTVVISSATVLFTSITGNDELMIAAEKAGQLTYLVSAFSIPIIISLLGLMISIISFSFNPPQQLINYSTLANWFLVFLVIYAAIGFLGAILIIIILEYGMATARSEK